EKRIPVLAFVEDVGASGGYMLACAADEIICDQYSIVGSIGVVGGTFGFTKLMDKLGVERRLYTSGDRKVMLDPFLPEKPDDVKRIKAIQKDIHEHFIGLVKARRGGKLSGSDKALFSGEFWTAEKAIELGLADRIGDLRSTLRERFGEKVYTPLISAERSLFGRRLPGVNFADAIADRPGIADELISELEVWALWSTYGLSGYWTGLFPNNFATAATCSRCSAIDAANSAALPGATICPVAVSRLTISGSDAASLMSAAILLRTASAMPGGPNSPTSPSNCSDG